MKPLTEEQLLALESIVDATSLRSVIDALATISRGKAEHVRANWQDAGTALMWEGAANSLDRASNANAVVRVSR